MQLGQWSISQSLIPVKAQVLQILAGHVLSQDHILSHTGTEVAHEHRFIFIWDVNQDVFEVRVEVENKIAIVQMGA